MIKKIILELVMLGAYFLVERWGSRILFGTGTNYHLHWAWVVLLFLAAYWNLGGYWFAYPVIGWMLIGLGLVGSQLWGSHQLIYSRYWPVFWQLSFYYAGVVFVLSLLGGQLPLV